MCDRQQQGTACTKQVWLANHAGKYPGKAASCRDRQQSFRTQLPRDVLSAGTATSPLCALGDHSTSPACPPPLGPIPAPSLNPTTAAFLPGGEENLTHAPAEIINKRAEEPRAHPLSRQLNHRARLLAHCSSAESVLLCWGTMAARKTCGLSNPAARRNQRRCVAVSKLIGLPTECQKRSELQLPPQKKSKPPALHRAWQQQFSFCLEAATSVFMIFLCLIG